MLRIARLALAGMVCHPCKAENFEAGPASAVERTGAASFLPFEVRRTGDITAPASISWELLPGSAGTPGDFSGPLSGLLSFGANQGSATLQVPLVTDSIPEPNEQLLCWLRPSPGDAITAPWSVVQTLDSYGTNAWTAGDRLLAGGIRPAGSLAVWKRPATAVDAWEPIEGPVSPISGPMVTNGLRLAGIVYAAAPELHIYELDDFAGTWTGPAVFPVPNGGAPHIIRISLSLSGDRMAMGVTGQNPGPIGAVELYSRSNGVWSHQATIRPQDFPETAGITQFGWRVSLTGDSFLTGGPGWSTNVIFDRSPEDQWTPGKVFMDAICGGFDGDSVLVSPFSGGIELRRRDAGGENHWGVSASAMVTGEVSRVWQDKGDFPAIVSNGGKVSILHFRENPPGQLVEVRSLAEWTYPDVPSIFSGPGGFLSQMVQPGQPPAQWHQRGAVPLTIIDDDGVEVRVAGGIVREDASPPILRFELQLNRAVDVPVIVAVKTAADTAVAGADFTPVDTSVTIPAGHWGAWADVPLVADSEVEAAERLLLHARLPELGGAETSGAFIIEDDDAPRFQHVESSLIEGDVDHAVALQVLRAGAIASAATVSFGFTGTATNPADYRATAGTLELPADTFSVPVGITIAGEFVTEQQENVVLQVNRGVAAPMPAVPWYHARNNRVPWTPPNNSPGLAAARDFVAAYGGNVARVLSLREDGTLNVTPLTGLPSQASIQGTGAACPDVVAALFTTDGNQDDAVAIWMREGSQWLPARIPFSEGTYGRLDKLTVQSGFVVLLSNSRLITLLRHAGGHNQWGVASVYDITVPASTPILASGQDWLALGLPFAEHTDGTVFTGAVYIFQRSWDSRNPWITEAVLRPPTAENSLRFGTRLFASGRLLAVHNEPSLSVTSREAAVFERPAAGAGAWVRTLTLSGYTTIKPVDNSLLVTSERDNETPRVLYYSRGSDTEPWSAETALEPGQRGVPPVGTGPLGASQFLIGNGIVTMHTDVAAEITVRSYVQGASVLLIEDDDPHPLVSIRDISVSEGAGTASIPIEFTGGGSWAFSFTTATTSVTALPGRDFTPVPVNVSGTMVQIPILNDGVPEPPEEFTFTLLSATPGKIVRGTAKVTIMDDDADPSRSTVLLATGAPVRIFAPASAAVFPPQWYVRSFNDVSWASGAGPVGYDRDPPSANTYHSLIGFNVQTAMYGRTPSLLSRSTFPIVAAPADGWLMLRIRYDDGFAAWLNGQLLGTSPGVTLPLPWNAAAASPGIAGAAEPASASIQIPAGSSLVPGSNVLALHGLNTSDTSSDFLISRELIHTRPYRVSYLDWIGAWQSLLTTGNYGPAGDVDSDGTANLVEWAAGTDAGTGPAPGVLAVSRRNGQVVIEVTVADPLPADVTCTLQSSASLTGVWSNEATLSGSLWTGSLQPESGDPVAPGRKRWTFQPPAGAVAEYFRLHAAMLD